jgi:polysaccharide biosynthesis transport protein
MSQPEENEEKDTPFNIMDPIYLLWSWVWLILLAGILAGTAAYFVSIHTTPQYETSIRLLVSDPPNMQGLNTSAMINTNTQTMTSTYAQMLVDGPVLQGVIDKLKLPITTDQLKPSISVNVVTNTQLLMVTVRDTNPQRAADIANTLATVFTTRILELQSQRYASTQDGLAQQVADMEKQIEDTNNAIATEKDPAQQLQLQARLTQYRSLYSNLVTNFEQVRMAEAQTSTNLFVSDPARVPVEPVSPTTSLNTVLAVLAGILLASVAIFIVDSVDDTIKNPDEIHDLFNLNVLGVISHHEVGDEKPICLAEPRSPVAEAFRTLRTNITFSSVDSPIRRIMVTSSNPQEGKTTIAANLAVVLAQGEKSVVLLDGDLRRPQVHSKFSLPNRLGLTNLFLQPLESLKGVVQILDDTRLGVVTSGGLPPNPAELLTSHKMTGIMDRLNQDFDIIVIDTPPVLTVTDALALSVGMDGVILVAKPGMTKHKEFKQTVELLRGVGARILGVVLNEIKPKSLRYGYYYSRYYSKNSHYYEDGWKKDKKKTKQKLQEA